MKKGFTRWYNYLIGLLLCGIVSCIAIIPYFVLNDANKWPATFITYTYMFSGIVIFGVGFIIQDIYRAKVRHQTKNWNNPLKKENLNTAWAIFTPAVIGGLVCIIIGIICSIIPMK
jgi:membrane protease YdiL (CAAX protease family)